MLISQAVLRLIEARNRVETFHQNSDYEEGLPAAQVAVDQALKDAEQDLDAAISQKVSEEVTKALAQTKAS